MPGRGDGQQMLCDSAVSNRESLPARERRHHTSRAAGDSGDPSGLGQDDRERGHGEGTHVENPRERVEVRAAEGTKARTKEISGLLDRHVPAQCGSRKQRQRTEVGRRNEVLQRRRRFRCRGDDSHAGVGPCAPSVPRARPALTTENSAQFRDSSTRSRRAFTRVPIGRFSPSIHRATGGLLN